MSLSLQSSQVDGGLERSMAKTDPAPLDEEELVLSWSSLEHTLKGVAAATKASDDEIQAIAQSVTSAVNEQHDTTLSIASDPSPNKFDPSRSLRDWHRIIASTSLAADALHRAKLALALTFLAYSGRQQVIVRPTDLDYVWSIIHDALSDSFIPFTVFRSAQGFFAIPLWALLRDGNIDELFRLHIWLPDGKRGNPDLAIHPHQAFAQSWILTGEGRNSTFDAENANLSTATHAEYALSWSDGSGQVNGKTYQLHQKFSVAASTEKLVRVIPRTSEVHSRNVTYALMKIPFARLDTDVLLRARSKLLTVVSVNMSLWLQLSRRT